MNRRYDVLDEPEVWSLDEPVYTQSFHILKAIVQEQILQVEVFIEADENTYIWPSIALSKWEFDERQKRKIFCLQIRAEVWF